MNIDDVAADQLPPATFAAMFARQAELMEKYHQIEQRNGFRVMHPPLNLHDAFAQARLKDFAWRVTEELAESRAAWIEGDAHHAREEAADATHFMLELLLLAGRSATDYPELSDLVAGLIPWDSTSAAMEVVLQLGSAMNCLKNKPWKQTHILTDEARFLHHLDLALEALLRYSLSIGASGAEEIAAYYFKKSEVNRFRQRSNY